MTDHSDETIAARISRVLADRIVTGQAPAPGSKLKQDHIAEEFGSSHVPVREALRRLEAQGLAISEPRRRRPRCVIRSCGRVQEVARMRAALEADRRFAMLLPTGRRPSSIRPNAPPLKATRPLMFAAG